MQHNMGEGTGSGGTSVARAEDLSEEMREAEAGGVLAGFFQALTALAAVDEAGKDAPSEERKMPMEAVLGPFGDFDYYEYPDRAEDSSKGEGSGQDISDLVVGLASLTMHTTTASIVVAESAISEARSLGSAVLNLATGSSSASTLPGRKKDTATPQKVAILYFDTGGGHRSAAQSLDAALKRTYGTRIEVELVEVSKVVPPPWSYASEIYQWLGAHPSVYERLWKQDDQETDFRNTRLYSNMRWNSVNHVIAWITDALSRGVDLFLSVHPFCNHLTGDALQQIAKAYGVDRVALQATVVTDLGAAHLSWFDPRCDVVFVPTQRLLERATELKVDPSHVIVHGLPVRQGFWDPVTVPKKVWRERLGILAPFCGDAGMEFHTTALDAEEPLVALLMGGGEGFGELQATAIAVGERLAEEAAYGLNSRLIVACGRNEAARAALLNHPWPPHHPPPVVLGFIGNIDEYMSAADVLLTKAGPGSIAEACIRGLPCLLTSFLPGQEEGNVTFVTEAGAGEYVSDQDPNAVAECLVKWFLDKPLVSRMSMCALQLGRPAATLDIARSIGEKLLGLEDDAEALESAELRATVGSSSPTTLVPPSASCGCGEGLKRFVSPRSRRPSSSPPSESIGQTFLSPTTSAGTRRSAGSK